MNLDSLDQRFITTKDLARLAGVTHETVRRWIRAGQVQAVRVGKKVLRISAAEAERVLQQPR